MAIGIERADASVWLSGVGWEEYVRLRDLPENYHVRMTYVDGDLELMSPSRPHERIATLIDRFIIVWTELRGAAIQGCRTTTLQRKDLSRGLEPDNGYYIEHEEQAREREELDLSVELPPDLAVEVDLRSPSRNRMPIYAAIGVPEVWLWRRGTLSVFRLAAGEYAAEEDSVCLPGFPFRLAERLIDRRSEMDDNGLARVFREEIRAQGGA